MENLAQTIEVPLRTVVMDPKTFHKMTFIMNALNRGWSIKKRDGAFIFSKKHEGKREVLMDNYLETFLESNFDMSVLARTDVDKRTF